MKTCDAAWSQLEKMKFGRLPHREDFEAGWDARDEEVKALRDFIEKFHTDVHNWSTRGCPTCDPASRQIGFDVGCTKHRSMVNVLQSRK